MLLTSKIALQPKQEVLIEPKEPTKVFAKLLHAMTSGALSPKEKHQTFTAIAMLQQLSLALSQAKITNIVRLAKDGHDFYFDTQGLDNDLAEAMHEFKVNTDAFEASLFNDLYLVLEHDDGQLRYLLEIDVKRVTRVNQLPITININAVVKSLEANPGETPPQLQQRLTGLFRDKEDYESFTARNQMIFERFVRSLEQTFRTAIRCEDIRLENRLQVIRPKKAAAGFEGDRSKAAMVHQGYSGWDNFAMYSLCWMSLMSSLNVHAADMDIINGSGDLLQTLDAQGIEAGTAELFDLSLDETLLAQPDSWSDGLFGGDDSDEEGSWLDFGNSGSSGNSSSSNE